VRKVIFGGATTLDNYFARKDHAVDWLLWDDEIAAIVAGYWNTFDTMVMGRKTYEVMQRSGDQGSDRSDVKTYVFSKTLGDGPRGNVTVVSSDPGAFVKSLKEQEGRDICVMGGGELGTALLEADVVDEIGFTIHPLLLGSGIPALHPMDRQIDLELRECRQLKNGCVLLTYRVRH
jgi:dihydrofolate reductase